MNFISTLFEFLVNLWPNLQFRGIFDILLVTCFIYAVLILLKRTRSFFIFYGIIILFFVYLAARFFNLYLTSLLFHFFFAFLAVILVIIFQKEFKNFFEWISASARMRLRILLRREVASAAKNAEVLDVVIKAAAYFSHNKIGVLIVLEGHQPIESLLGDEVGYDLNGFVSLPILLSIFDPSSAGHDGAVIIKDSVIKKFGAHLPLAKRFMKFGQLGTRHRAALGLAEISDALIIAVSEETGRISLAQRGMLNTLPGVNELKGEVEEFLKERIIFPSSGRHWYNWFKLNIREKITAFILAVLLWLVLAAPASIITREYQVPIEFRGLKKEYLIEQLEPKKIDLTLSGRKQDFRFLDNEDLAVMIDAGDLPDGWHQITIKEKNIIRPANLSVFEFSPLSIKIRIVDRTVLESVETPRE